MHKVRWGAYVLYSHFTESLNNCNLLKMAADLRSSSIIDRLSKKSTQFLCYSFRFATSIHISRATMTKSGELNTCDLWQDLL